jgi:hypothetical protein
MHRLLLLFGGLVLVLGVLEPAHADTLYNNLANAPSTILGTLPIGPAGPEGDSFSTGTSSFSLTNVTLALQGVQDSESFTISLFSDNDTTCAAGPACTGGPLSLLYTIATVSDNSLSTSLTNDVFNLATAQTLAADTTYWIVASSSNGSGVLWSYTEDLSGTGIAGNFNYDAYGLVPNSPITAEYPNCAYSKSSGTEDQCTPFQMAVSGTAMPEPSSSELLGIGLIALLSFLWWRKQPARGESLPETRLV